MNKQDIITFFDRCAPSWDADMIRNEEVIAKILDNAGIESGKEVLDVACGTGVLFPDYLKRGVKSVVGVDISPEMVKIAQEKFIDKNIRVICADIENIELDHEFDCCMVYNAFPHFPEPSALIEVLARKVKTCGRLSIAHGMSREAINLHHSENACSVSLTLMHEDELAKLFSPYFEVDHVISDDRMYQVCGIKK